MVSISSSWIIGIADELGWVEVQWDHGKANSYRMGAEGKFDLELTGEDPAIPPPPEDEFPESVSSIDDASDEVAICNCYKGG